MYRFSAVAIFAIITLTGSLASAESPPCDLESEFEITAEVEGGDAAPVTATNEPLALPQDDTGASCLTLGVGTCYSTDMTLQNDCNAAATWTCDGGEAITVDAGNSVFLRSAGDEAVPRSGDFTHDCVVSIGETNILVTVDVSEYELEASGGTSGGASAESDAACSSAGGSPSESPAVPVLLALAALGLARSGRE